MVAREGGANNKMNILFNNIVLHIHRLLQSHTEYPCAMEQLFFTNMYSQSEVLLLGKSSSGPIFFPKSSWVSGKVSADAMVLMGTTLSLLYIMPLIFANDTICGLSSHKGNLSYFFSDLLSVMDV